MYSCINIFYEFHIDQNIITLLLANKKTVDEYFMLNLLSEPFLLGAPKLKHSFLGTVTYKILNHVFTVPSKPAVQHVQKGFQFTTWVERIIPALAITNEQIHTWF